MRRAWALSAPLRPSEATTTPTTAPVTDRTGTADRISSPSGTWSSSCSERPEAAARAANRSAEAIARARGRPTSPTEVRNAASGVPVGPGATR